MRRSTFLVLTISLAGVAADASVSAQNKHGDAYAIDEEETLLYVQAYKKNGTLGSSFAHNHVVVAEQTRGTVRFDPDHPKACKFSLDIPVRHLVVDRPSARRRVGFEPVDVGRGTRAKIRESMLSSGQLDPKDFPVIRFRASNCERHGKGYRVRARLRIRGQTTTVVFPAAIAVDGDKLTARGHFRIRHRDVGMEPYSAFLGAVKVAQPLDFTGHIVAHRTH